MGGGGAGGDKFQKTREPEGEDGFINEARCGEQQCGSEILGEQ
jgi:hypothetical protein